MAAHGFILEEKQDRRDNGGREVVVAAVVTAYSDLPALSLTAAQTARLLGLRIDVSERVLTELAQRRVLYRVGGRYRLREVMTRTG